jgi:hypothetical protein
MKRILIISAGLIFAILSTAGTLPPRWEQLGIRKVNKAYDRDEIVITRAEGTFNALKFKVVDRSITLYDMKVHYGNGTVEDVRTRIHIPAGGETRVIDLRGGNRVIKKVVFRYETKRVRGKRATLYLYGRH